MEELKRTKRITIATFSFVIVLAIAFFTLKKPMFEFKTAPEDMAFELMMVEQVTPEDAMMLVYDSTVIFVDIRNIYDYRADHLENAISIPTAKLLNKENKSLFDKWQADSLQVVLYGRDELQATSPWMLLYQLGYTNTTLLLGGMDYVIKLYEGDVNDDNTFNVEAPAYDYAGIIAAASSGESTVAASQPKKTVVVRKKKKKAAEGGC
ncbi:MAG: hypothetical protein DRI71_04220 [Bacteroidetes bacterium]|nr:MAG: hypothetical protein DRI71_04220 [Bacteroidota bacterium]